MNGSKPLIKEMKAYLEGRVEFYAPLALDTLEREERGVALIQRGGPFALRRYFCGGFVGSFAFAVYCKSPDKEQACRQLAAVEQVFAACGLPELEGAAVLKVEQTSAPSLLKAEKDGSYIYGAEYALSYYKEVAEHV
ncbi:MAG: hypothetical protein FWE85_03130 [Clostridiales bacterium]|nr:hypothetical protein [Clostridiales bacterium]